MPVSHISKVFAVEDAKIGKMTADVAASPPTYAALVDVPGIKSVTVSGDIDTKELRGDNTLLDVFSKLTNVSVSIEHAKLSLDVLPVLLGGATVDSGTGSTEVATYGLTGNDSFNYFKLEAKTPAGGVDTIGGDAHFVFYKCMLSSFPDLGMAEEDYRTSAFEVRATPIIGTGNKWFDVVLNETAAAIA